MIELGELVYASDGKLLGRVGELRDEFFKVNADFRLDYWLPISCVTERADDLLVTDFDYAHLSDHLREPGSL